MIIALLVFTLLLSALFSGLEMAYVSSDKLKLAISEEGNKGSLIHKIITRIIRKPEEFICSMLVGNNLALTGYGLLFSMLITKLLGEVIPLDSLRLVIEIVLSTTIILVLGEFLPKSIFQNSPNLLLKRFAIPIQFVYLFYPITLIFLWLSKIMLRIMKVKEVKNRFIFSKNDLKFFIEGVKDRDLEQETQDLLVMKNALEFNVIKLRDCMVPRINVEMIEIDESIETLKQQFIDTKYSKIFIYKEEPDQMIGYVHVKDLFKSPESLKSIIITVPFFSEASSAKEVLNTFLEDQKHAAVVLDEFGGVSGIVTIEDLVEEIFGEIEDEYDLEKFEEQKLANNKYLFSASLEVDYLNDKYALDIPVSPDYETLAGFIFYNHGNLPMLNENIEIENFEIRINKMIANKIDLVIIEKKDYEGTSNR